VAQSIETLRIAMMVGGGGTILRDAAGVSELGDVDIGKIDVSTFTPPDALVGLSLLQSGKGYRIGFYHSSWSDDQSYDDSDDESDNDVESTYYHGEDGDNETMNESEDRSEEDSAITSDESEDEDATETPTLLSLCHSIQTLRTYDYARTDTKEYDWEPAQLIEE
jgi:hypothetical protein